MDAFYASVEQRDHPELATKPMVVGGTPKQRGVVAAASYLARNYGIRSAMPSRTAVKLCPNLVFVPMRMSHYIEVSKQINDIFHRYTPLVEPLSLDEAFLDVSGSKHLFGDVTTIARRIKYEIHSELGLIASVGIAPNKFIAKIASDLEKPDGFVAVYPPFNEFLDPLPVRRLWGIGKVAERKLRSAGIQTIGDFRHADRKILQRCVGNAVQNLLKLAQGEDDRKVVPKRPSVTISHETTFAVDVDNIESLESTLLRLSEKLAGRLRHKHLSARTISIKLRDSNFKTISRSNTQLPTNVTREIWQTARELLHRALSDSFKIRLIGVQASSLENVDDVNYFFQESDEDSRQKKIDSVLDEINQNFGTSTVHRGIDQT